MVDITLSGKLSEKEGLEANVESNVNEADVETDKICLDCLTGNQQGDLEKCWKSGSSNVMDIEVGLPTRQS